jgi:hypothetical protein
VPSDTEANQVEAALTRLIEGLETKMLRLVNERLAAVGRQVDERLREMENDLRKIKTGVHQALLDIPDDDLDDDEDDEDDADEFEDREPHAEGA